MNPLYNTDTYELNTGIPVLRLERPVLPLCLKLLLFHLSILKFDELYSFLPISIRIIHYVVCTILCRVVKVSKYDVVSILTKYTINNIIHNCIEIKPPQGSNVKLKTQR